MEIDENVCSPSIELARKVAALQNRISEYQLKNLEHIDPSVFLKDAAIFFYNETKELLGEHNTIKIHVSFQVRFIKQHIDENGEFRDERMDYYFNTKSTITTKTTDLVKFYEDGIVERLLNKISDFQSMGSDWAIDAIIGLNISNCKYEPFNGSSYMKLPKFIDSKNAVINIKNDDNKCFLWAILAALHHKEIKTNLQRVTKYKKYEAEVNMKGIQYPVSIQQIDLFEKQNSNISVNVYMYEKKKSKFGGEHPQIYPVRLTKKVRSSHVHLLLTSQCDHEVECENEMDVNVGENIVECLDTCSTNFHYCFVKDLSRLLQAQISTVNRRKKYFCDRCLNYFYSEDKLATHAAACIRINFAKITLPNENEKWLEFKNYNRKLDMPFIVYADIEAILQPILPDADIQYLPKGAYQKHIPHSVGFYFHSKQLDICESFYRSYSGFDCMTWFTNEMKGIAKSVYPILKTAKKMLPLSSEQQTDYDTSKICHICERKIDESATKVKDHSHITGEFRGAAHQACNINYCEPNFVPVVFHNLKYDLHLLIESLAAIDAGNVDIIPCTAENYVSFTKTFHAKDLLEPDQNKVYEYNDCIKLRFIDSFRFLAASLEKLASNLDKSNLVITKNVWGDLSEEKFSLLTKKGIYPYDYISSQERLNETSLPHIDQFYNRLNETAITQEEYDFALLVWSTFEIENLQEYTEIYLKTDVLLLADIFENFRAASLASYGLDPGHYFTLPGYSWDAMLKITSARIELIQNIDQMIFFEEGKTFQLKFTNEHIIE